MRLKVIYIAGPYRGPSHYAVMQNIHRAEALALQVWAMGAVALCPHMNTANFDGLLEDRVWLEGDLELLRRCDALITTPDWQNSTGATAEVEFAQINGIKIFHGLAELRAYIGWGSPLR